MAALSSRLGARTHVVDEIVDDSILSLCLIADRKTYLGVSRQNGPRLIVAHALRDQMKRRVTTLGRRVRKGAAARAGIVPFNNKN